MKVCSLLSGLLIAGFCAPALAQSCTPTPQTHAVPVLAADGGTSPTVAGDQGFSFELENGWVFALLKDPAGWSVRLFQYSEDGTSSDLTSLTPPHGGAPNPRDIYGWHFRNAANTGPNAGDVNAPQHMRAFIISPDLAGTGGYKPSTDPDELRLMEPGPNDGIGWLRIEDMGLGNLEEGERATMNYLKFSACISWPKSDSEQIAEADAASLEFNALDRGLFTGCGLDMATYELNAQFLPRRKNVDLNGNGITDVVAQVVRQSDGARGLALCTDATGIYVFGFDSGDSGPGLDAGYVGQTEAWQWVAPGDARPRHLSNVELPQSDSGHLILERVEKQAIALFWNNGELDSEQLYRFVEP